MTIREFYTLVGGSYDDMSERFPSDALFEAVQREYDKVTGALVQLTA